MNELLKALLEEAALAETKMDCHVNNNLTMREWMVSIAETWADDLLEYTCDGGIDEDQYEDD